MLCCLLRMRPSLRKWRHRGMARVAKSAARNFLQSYALGAWPLRESVHAVPMLPRKPIPAMPFACVLLGTQLAWKGKRRCSDPYSACAPKPLEATSKVSSVRRACPTNAKP